MSAESDSDHAADPQDAPPSILAPENLQGAGTPKRGQLRQFILLGLLGLMIVALAYDYRIARPNVDKAFDQIVKLNDQMNVSADAKPTLNTHIHKEIGRDPARAYTEGPYRVEVFSWTAGLPFRTHDLYAVYMPNGNDLIFMRHYKYSMPADELDPPRQDPAGGGDDDGSEGGGLPAPPIGMGPGGPSRPPGPGGPGGPSGRPQRPGGGDENAEGRPQRPPSGDENPEGTPDPSTPDPSTPDPSTPDPSTPDPSTPDPSTPEASTPEASTPEASTPEASTPEASTPEASTPEASTPEASTPEAGAPVEGDPAAEASPAAADE